MKNVVILGVLALILGGFAYFALFATPANKMADEAASNADELSQEPAKTPLVPEPRQGTGTLEYLRLLGENLECTISYTDEEQHSTVDGTYFVNEGNMRGDFLTESPDLTGQVLSSMIIKDGQLFVWSEIEGVEYGVRTSLASTFDSGVQSHEPVSLTATVAYDCKPWKEVDKTVFMPPSDVLFKDMNELKRTGMEYGTTYGNDVNALEGQ